MCKVFRFHCKKFSCGENEHYIEEPEYCADYEKLFIKRNLLGKKKEIEKPPWVPTRLMTDKLMTDTGSEEPQHIVRGCRYLHHDHPPVGCGNIQMVEQGTGKTCPFGDDFEICMEIYLRILDERNKKEAEKERKDMMKSFYLGL